jgi:hypothetical protein
MFGSLDCIMTSIIITKRQEKEEEAYELARNSVGDNQLDPGGS